MRSVVQKDLLGLYGVPAEEILRILALARDMKKIVLSDQKKTSDLAGKSVITLFYENSTRTRMSFEMAAKYMSASAANMSASASSVQKGESLIDTGRTLDRMGTDVIVIRHPMTAAPRMLAGHVKASVINAGDGINEHPTQALLDMFTMQEYFGGFKGLHVTIVGDIYHSRVARSNLFGLTQLGAEVTLCGPSTLMPKDIEKLGAKVVHDEKQAVQQADVVMALRIQKERQKGGLFPSVSEYNSRFGVSHELLSYAKKGALVMHPGPINRGIEINSSVADSDVSKIDEQVTSGISVRMALLKILTEGGIRHEYAD